MRRGIRCACTERTSCRWRGRPRQTSAGNRLRAAVAEGPRDVISRFAVSANHTVLGVPTRWLGQSLGCAKCPVVGARSGSILVPAVSRVCLPFSSTEGASAAKSGLSAFETKFQNQARYRNKTMPKPWRATHAPALALYLFLRTPTPFVRRSLRLRHCTLTFADGTPNRIFASSVIGASRYSKCRSTSTSFKKRDCAIESGQTNT